MSNPTAVKDALEEYTRFLEFSNVNFLGKSNEVCAMYDMLVMVCNMTLESGEFDLSYSNRIIRAILAVNMHVGATRVPRADRLTENLTNAILSYLDKCNLEKVNT